MFLSLDTCLEYADCTVVEAQTNRQRKGTEAGRAFAYSPFARYNKEESKH